MKTERANRSRTITALLLSGFIFALGALTAVVLADDLTIPGPSKTAGPTTVDLQSAIQALQAAGYDVKPKAPTITLTVDKSTIPVGGSAVLTWKSQWATGVTIPGVEGTLLPSGSVTVAPAQTANFVASATGPGGSTDSPSLTLTVVQLPVVTISVSPATITAGDSAIITGSVVGADSFKIDPAPPTQPDNTALFKIAVNPTVTTTFTVSGTNIAGTVTAQATLPVMPRPPPKPPTVTLVADPPQITVGQTSHLKFSQIDGSSGHMTPLVAPDSIFSQPAGDIPVNPSVSTTYTLVVTGSGGITQASTTLVVQPIPAPAAWTLRPHGQRMFIRDDNIADIKIKLAAYPTLTLIKDLTKGADSGDGFSGALLLRLGLVTDPAKVVAYTKSAIGGLIGQTSKTDPGTAWGSNWNIASSGIYFACVYDWMYAALTPDQRTALIAYVHTQLITSGGGYGGANSWCGAGLILALAIAEVDNDDYVTRFFNVQFAPQKDNPPHWNWTWGREAYPEGGCPEGLTYASAWHGNQICSFAWKAATNLDDMAHLRPLSEHVFLTYWGTYWPTAKPGQNSFLKYQTEKYDLPDGEAYNARRTWQILTGHVESEVAGTAAWLLKNGASRSTSTTEDALLACIIGDPRVPPTKPAGTDYIRLQSCCVHLHTTNGADDMFVSFRNNRQFSRVMNCNNVVVHASGKPILTGRTLEWPHSYSPEWVRNNITYRSVDGRQTLSTKNPDGTTTTVPNPTFNQFVRVAFTEWNTGELRWGNLNSPIVQEADGSFTSEVPNWFYNRVSSAIPNSAIKLSRRNVRFDKANKTVVIKDHVECNDALLRPWANWNLQNAPQIAGNIVTILDSNGAALATMTLDGAVDIRTTGGPPQGWCTDLDGTVSPGEAATQAAFDAGGNPDWGTVHMQLERVSAGVFEGTATIQVN